MNEEKLNNELIKTLIENENKRVQIRETLRFVEDASNKYLSGQKRHPKITWLVTSLTITSAAILILSLTVLPSIIPINAEDQFQAFHKKFDGNFAVRGEVDITPWESAYNLYQSGQLNEASQLADSVLSSYPFDHKMLFLSGLISIEQGEYVAAAKSFIATSGLGGSYEVYSRWYLALIYLKQHKYSDCREELRILKQIYNKELRTKVGKLYRKIRFRMDK